MPLLVWSKDHTLQGTRSQPARPQPVVQHAWHVSPLAILSGVKTCVRSCCDCGWGQHSRQRTAAACAQHTIRQHSPQLPGQFFPAPAMNEWGFTWTSQDGVCHMAALGVHSRGQPEGCTHFAPPPVRTSATVGSTTRALYSLCGGARGLWIRRALWALVPFNVRSTCVLDLSN